MSVGPRKRPPLAGVLVALPLGLMRVSKRPWVNFPAWLYTYVIRGTPMLVQLFLIYYGLAQFDAVRQGPLWPYLRDPFWCAIITMTLHTAAYIAEIKDAGVRTALVNIDPDRFNCEADVYYDPMLVAETVESACREAVRNYIENLPFNGEYTNMALVDALQTLDGVRIVEFRGATTVAAGEEVLVTIDARCIPAAGYFEMGDVVLNMKAYNG